MQQVVLQVAVGSVRGGSRALHGGSMGRGGSMGLLVARGGSREVHERQFAGLLLLRLLQQVRGSTGVVGAVIQWVECSLERQW